MKLTKEYITARLEEKLEAALEAKTTEVAESLLEDCTCYDKEDCDCEHIGDDKEDEFVREELEESSAHWEAHRAARDRITKKKRKVLTPDEFHQAAGGEEKKTVVKPVKELGRSHWGNPMESVGALEEGTETFSVHHNTKGKLKTFKHDEVAKADAYIHRHHAQFNKGGSVNDYKLKRNVQESVDDLEENKLGEIQVKAQDAEIARRKELDKKRMAGLDAMSNRKGVGEENWHSKAQGKHKKRD